MSPAVRWYYILQARMPPADTEDPQIGRFMQLDPLADDFPYYTPYQFAGNDPIANVDLDGLEDVNAVNIGVNAGEEAFRGGEIAELMQVIVVPTKVAKSSSTLLSVSGNFPKGVFQSAWGTIKGVGQIIIHPINTIQGIVHVVVHPIQTFNALKKVVIQTYHEFKNGDGNTKAVILGNALGDVAQLFVGAGEVRAVEESADIGKTVQRVEKLAKEAEQAEEVMTSPKFRSVTQEAEEAENVVNETEKVAKNGETAATKNGRLKHKEYKANEVKKGVREKEYTLENGQRVDFIDFENKIIYELKPNNARARALGKKQLKEYKIQVEKEREETGWTTILDTY